MYLIIRSIYFWIIQEHPELDTTDIKIRDVNARIQQAAKRPGHPGRPPGSSKKHEKQAKLKMEPDLNFSSESNSTMASQAFKIPIDEPHIKKSPSLSSLNSFSKSVLFNNIHNSFSDSEHEIELREDIKTEIKSETIESLASPLFFEAFKPIHNQPQTSAVTVTKPRLISALHASENESGANKAASPVVAPIVNNVNDFLVKEEETDAHTGTTGPIIRTQGLQDQKPSVEALESPAIIKVEISPEKVRNFVNVASFTDKPATLSDLDGIDMMHLPVDLDDSSHIDILSDIVDVKNDLIQETHACFLSLIRDIFCSTPDHRTTTDVLRSKVSAWVANPITALNEWFSQADSWLSLLPSSVHFLAGEFLDQPDEFVPYLEYKPNLHIYQWIGAGRDSDQHLKPLCEYWLNRRNEMGTRPPPKHNNDATKSKQYGGHMDLEEALSNNGNSAERLASPPPPRCPTTWLVNKASSTEIADFREQERRRFESPHLSFTYRMHGYESVVGPVKGIYTQIPALTKARGHNMLTQDRPSFVTILTLVRDATARLPNGEGTRADICELLKSSQYISPSASETVLQTIVSGALDRMHTEHDPCVRYDTKRKIWIYLHRNRTEEEFDRMHQQFQGVSKHKKQGNRKLKTKLTSSKSPTPTKKSDCSTMELIGDGSPVPMIQTASPTPQAPVPKKKIIINAMPVQATAPITTTATHQGTPVKIQTVGLSSVQVAANQQPVVISAAPQMPALSSIQNPGVLHTGNIPPLINKTGQQQQKKAFIQPELVPIVLDNVEHIDVEASLDVHTTPITVKKITKQSTVKQIQQPMPSLIVDKTHKLINKNMVKPVVGIVSSAATTPIKVSTSSGIQTVMVSAAHQSIVKPTIATILTPTNNQSVLIANSPNSTSSPTRKVTVTQKPPPPLVAQSTPTGFVTIPISIGKANQQIKQIQAVVSQANIGGAKVQKATIPGLTSTVVPRMSLLQTQQPLNANKTTIRATAAVVPPGKSLISPTIAANNLNIQQQVQQTNTIVPTSSVQILHTKPLQQQKIIVASVASPSATKTTFVAAGPAIQKIISMSKAAASPSSTIMTTAAGTVTPVVQGISAISTAGTSLISPQIIQIHQGGQRTQQLPAGAKIQTVSAANLTPLQQQNLLQSLKNQQIRVQNQQATNASPQTLIIKQQQVLQQIQKQFQQQQQNQQQSSQLNSPTKPNTSMMGTPIQLSPSVSGAQLTSMIVSGSAISTTSTQSQNSLAMARTLKAGTSLITAQPTQIASVSPTTAATMRTVTGTSPLVGKVLTNQAGQIISLESLLQKQANSGPTLRIAGAKPGQTSLIQLAGTPGSQIAQYAVVSQGRNIISMAQPRLITTQAMGSVINTSTINTGVVSTSSSRPATVSVLTAANAKSSDITSKLSTPTRAVVVTAAGGTNVLVAQPNQTISHAGQTAPRIIQSAQLQSLNAQTLVNAKVLGVQNLQSSAAANRVKAGTSIRMASNLNIAHIGGKPVIIASKTPAIIQQSSQAQQQGGARQNVIWTQAAQSGANNSIVIGGQTVKVQGNVLTTTTPTHFDSTSSASTATAATTLQTSQPAQQTVMFGNQIVKLQAHQPTASMQVSSVQGQTTTVLAGSASSAGMTTPTRTVVLGSTGQTIKVPAAMATQAGATTAGKVTLAASQQQVVIGGAGIKVSLLTNHQFNSANINSFELFSFRMLSKERQWPHRRVNEWCSFKAVADKFCCHRTSKAAQSTWNHCKVSKWFRYNSHKLGKFNKIQVNNAPNLFSNIIFIPNGVYKF